MWPFVSDIFNLLCFQDSSDVVVLFIPFYCQIIFHCTNVPSFIYPSIDGYWDTSTLGY
jgi:hypothetical protein